MSSLPVIPTPSSQRWMDFRVQWLPVIMFSAVVAATLFVWKEYVFPASMVGRVEGIRADVSLPKSGVVTKLFVTRFQMVTAGERIAEIAPVDLKILEASLGVIRADIDLMRSGVNPTTIAQTMAIDYDKLKLDWLRQRVTVATKRTELELAEIELVRSEKLWKDKIIPDAEYETSRTRRDALKTSLEEHVKLSADLELSLQRLLPASDTALGSTAVQFKAAIAVQEEKLKLTEAEMAPRIITAPISGTVSMISKWCGETVAAADPVATISSTNSDRAIGYLRQPFYINPMTNMVVQIRTRGLHRRNGCGRILAIGQQLLPITDVLLPPTKYNVAETGLPLLISLPPEIKKMVRPGEFVDLTIVPGAKATL